jgi:hypothetical protein
MSARSKSDDNRSRVGATSQYAEIVVPASLTLNLLGYAWLNAHPPVIVLAFLSYQCRDQFHDVQDLQFIYGTCYIMTHWHVSEAGSSICQKGAGESHQYSIPVL